MISSLLAISLNHREVSPALASHLATSFRVKKESKTPVMAIFTLEKTSGPSLNHQQKDIMISYDMGRIYQTYPI